MKSIEMKNELINYNTEEKDNKLIIGKITDKVITEVKDLNYVGIEIRDNNINKVCDLIENLKESVVITYVENLEDVKKELKRRFTYQGFKRSILNEVKRQVLMRVKSDDWVIDATVGNGNDTYFLASVVPNGKVIGLDIQEKAIDNTTELVKDFNNVYLYLMGHENIAKLRLAQPVKVVLFNLGYLPNGDKHVTTTAPTTIKAISQSLDILSDDGFILVVVYPGHEEGLKESVAITNYLSENNLKYQIKRNTNNPVAPYLIIIYKRNN